MRYIKLTDELKKSVLKTFQEKLNNERFSDKRISFTFDLDNKDLDNDDKVILNIRPTAWLKMWTLVHSENKEIGWHGLITRHSEKIFELTDIMMYPQVTTAVTVVTDDVEYGNWLHKEVSDEDINHLRFHGHSHVNMGTSPSGVDTTWYDQILQGLEADDFYIFMILNKREDYFIEIYDLKTNTIYEKKDITINIIMENDNYLDNWVDKQKETYLKEPEKTIAGFGDRLPSLDKIAKITEEEEQECFEDLLMNLSVSDFADEGLVQGIVDELNKKVYSTMYYGVGWQKWNFMSKEDKILTAQEYYMTHPATNLLEPKKKKKSKKMDYYYGGYYDKYY